MADKQKTAPLASEKEVSAEPSKAATETPELRSTGLADYGYWMNWLQSLPKPPAASGRPFRRGLIWR